MKKILLVLSVIFLSLTSYGGNERGNGGSGVVCRNADGSIRSAELLDIYEGRVLGGLRYSDLPGTIDQKFNQVIADVFKEAPNFGIWSIIYTIKDNIVMLPPGVELEPINDSLHISIPRNCKIEQVANFYNQKKLFINSDIYKSFDDLNRLGLLLHEILYYMDRATGVTNSRYVRRSVAKLLSDNFRADFPLNISETVGTYLCSTSSEKITEFFAIPKGNNEWKFLFTVLNGHRIFSEKYAIVKASSDIFPVTRVNDQADIYTEYDLVSKIDGDEVLLLGFSTEAMKIGWTGFDPDDSIDMETFTCGEIRSMEDL